MSQKFGENPQISPNFLELQSYSLHGQFPGHVEGKPHSFDIAVFMMMYMGSVEIVEPLGRNKMFESVSKDHYHSFNSANFKYKALNQIKSNRIKSSA